MRDGAVEPFHQHHQQGSDRGRGGLSAARAAVAATAQQRNSELGLTPRTGSVQPMNPFWREISHYNHHVNKISPRQTMTQFENLPLSDCMYFSFFVKILK